MSSDPLRALLRRARPAWSCKDLFSAEQKLRKLGVSDVAALAAALGSEVAAGPLNDRLRAIGCKAFTVETIDCLSQQVLSDAALAGEQLLHDHGGELLRGSASTAGTLAVASAEDNRPKAAADDKINGGLESNATESPKPDVLAAGIGGDGAIVDEQEAVTSLQPTTMGAASSSISPLGVWICQGSRRSYEIRSLEDMAIRVVLSKADIGRTLDPNGFWYAERLECGRLLFGVLAETMLSPREGQWEGELNDQTIVQLRYEGDRLTSKFRASEVDSWGPPIAAEKPQWYAFYNAYDAAGGSRYAHLNCGSDAKAWFPLVGLTSGWLPAELVGSTELPKGSPESCVRVRFLGTFCDPFDISDPQPLASRIQVVSGHSHSRRPQVAFRHDGSVLVSQGAGRATGNSWDNPRPGRLGGGLRAGPRLMLPPTDPHQAVAKALGCTVAELQAKAFFRGALRSLPLSTCRQDLELNVPSRLVRPAQPGPVGAAAVSTPFVSAGVVPPQPLLSVLCVRWYDYWSEPSKSSDFSTMNDGFFADLLHGPCSMGKLLPGEYEVYTVFVRQTSDLARLDPVHLRALLKGKNTIGWYFVWPGSDDPGSVREREFFDFCERMECVPLRTGWPHESRLYRTLCSKLWIPEMCADPDFWVPPTVLLDFEDFRLDNRRAGIKALSAVAALRKTLWSKTEEDFCGVIKLGFSWCGADVLPFQGLESLIVNVSKLCERRGDNTIVCLVQEMVLGVVCELRILCIFDRAKRSFRREVLWMETCKVKTIGSTSFAMTSSKSVTRAFAERKYFEGDEVGLDQAQRKALKLADRWLQWFQTQSPEPPQSTRLDFLVTHPRAGHAEVWTVEVGECGCSLCSIEVHGRNVAALNTAILEDSSGRFPMRVPPELPRNSGWKS